ncbi:MAG: hypothetical protein IJS91_06895 [Bacteroidales bacterium]|nr:hypothetical protein [Bacteroidales bacterium]
MPLSKTPFLKILFLLAALLPLFSCQPENEPSEPSGPEVKEYTEEEVRSALMNLYEATRGSGWVSNDGWCTDAPLNDWFGITADEGGVVRKIELRGNGLKGTLPDIFDRFPKLELLRLDDNYLSGPLPQTFRQIATDNFTAYLSGNTFETTTLRVPEARIEPLSTALRVYPSNNPSFRIFVDSDRDGKGEYYSDGQVEVVHKAEEGKGYDLIIIGDGFDKDENSIDGTAAYWLRIAAQAHFDIDPMDKLYKYFNVYIIYNWSPVRGISLGTDRINSRFHYCQADLNNGAVTFDFVSCKKFIEDALGRPIMDGAAVCVVPNCTQNAIVGGIEYRKATAAYAFCPIRATVFRQLVRHECVGHAIGRLIDEYSGSGIYHAGDANPVASAPNGDIVSDPSRVKWAQFLSDSRYKNEDLGIFEGCKAYKSGVYRPSYKSMMNGSSLRNEFFNAPSRASIYKYVMSAAFGESVFNFDYETFVEWDMSGK